MSRRWSWLAVVFFTSLSWADDDALVLPRWPEDELRAMQNSGQPAPMPGLWPRGMTDVVPMPMTGSMVAQDPHADSPETEQPHADLSRFLPPALVVGNTRSKVRPRDDSKRVLSEVSAAFLAEAESTSAAQRFIDPSHRVPEVERDTFENFLESHARDARIALHVLVIGPDEKLSASADLSRIAKGSLLERDACLAVIPFGEPWRLRLFMSRSVQEKLPADELSQILDDAIRNSLGESAALGQLHRLLVRLSIRLFWVESALNSQPDEVVARALPAVALPEILDTTPASEPWKLRPLFLWLAFIAAGALGFYAWRRWLAYRSRHYEWILPESPLIKPRLGCPHGATAAWISYH